MVATVVVSFAAFCAVVNAWVGPVSSGGFDKSSNDAFRKGFSTNSDNSLDQTSAANLQSAYKRGNTAQQDLHSTTIDGPFASASNAAKLTANADRGAVIDDQSMAAGQHASSTSTALDTGKARTNAFSDATIGPYQADGASASDSVIARHQNVANNDHVNQFVDQQHTNTEAYDRAAANKAAASQTAIGPDGSLGSANKDFAVTRDQGYFVNRQPGSGTFTKSHQANLATNMNNDAVEKTHLNSDSSIGPDGFAAGNFNKDNAVKTRQRGFQTADQEDLSTENAGSLKALDSAWAKGSTASQVGIGGVVSPGSFGGNANQFVSGHDKLWDKNNIDTNNHKTSSSASKQFDDRDTRNSLASTSAINP